MAALLPWLSAVALALAGCSRVDEPAGAKHTSPTVSAVAALSVTPAPAVVPAPTELLTLPSSAYQAWLFADELAVELLTSNAAYQLAAGKPPVRYELDVSFAATVTRQSYVYWSKGALWGAARRGAAAGKPKQLAVVADQPRLIASDIAADELAWLAPATGGGTAIERLEKGGVKRLYTSKSSIDTLTLVGDTVYFVERPSAGAFRIGRVKLSGGDAAFTASKSGRWPAMLRGRRELFYYDGSGREVLALSLDLERERSLAKDQICSPLAVAVGESVYCAGVEGIFELPTAGKPRQLVPGSRGLVTSLAASSERLAFVADAGASGKDRLTVYAVPLASAPR